MLSFVNFKCDKLPKRKNFSLLQVKLGQAILVALRVVGALTLPVSNAQHAPDVPL